jgi:phospholipid/cholesterol/gamma-HCH transport system permease protein
METLGLDPVEILVLPRTFALLITLPLLTFYANIVGLVGGAIMSNLVLDITFSQFVTQLETAIDLTTLILGLVKAPVFAFIIAMVGCYEGFQVSGSAESVGRQTTKAVVEAIFLVIVVNALFSVLFATMGL